MPKARPHRTPKDWSRVTQERNISNIQSAKVTIQHAKGKGNLSLPLEEQLLKVKKKIRYLNGAIADNVKTIGLLVNEDRKAELEAETLKFRHFLNKAIIGAQTIAQKIVTRDERLARGNATHERNIGLMAIAAKEHSRKLALARETNNKLLANAFTDNFDSKYGASQELYKKGVGGIKESKVKRNGSIVKVRRYQVDEPRERNAANGKVKVISPKSRQKPENILTRGFKDVFRPIEANPNEGKHKLTIGLDKDVFEHRLALEDVEQKRIEFKRKMRANSRKALS